MNSFLKLLVASFKEFSRDRTTLSFTVILPLLLVAFFGFAFGSSSQKLQIGVVRASETSASGSQRAMNAYVSALSNIDVHFEIGSRSTELSRLRDGTIDAVLLVDNGLKILYERGNGRAALGVAGLRYKLAGIEYTIQPERTSVGAPWGISFGALSGPSNSRLDYVVPGILATAIMWLGIFAAIPLVQQREQQVLRRYAVTPVTRTRVVLAQVVSRLGVSLAQAVFVLAAARLFFGVPIGAELASPWKVILVLTGLVVLGALAFVSIGYAVAALSATQSSAHAWAQLLTMPMLVLAGVFFPVSAMPGFLQPLVAVLPLTYLADALRQTAIHSQTFAPIGVDLAILGAWIVVSLGIAIRFFRWSQ
jgi:ABC-2 type transport system permease protein